MARKTPAKNQNKSTVNQTTENNVNAKDKSSKSKAALQATNVESKEALYKRVKLELVKTLITAAVAMAVGIVAGNFIKF